MPKHSRKRQRTADDSYSVQHALVDDASKDDEERRLESLLFGTKFVPSTETNLAPQDGGSKEMQNLTDTDKTTSMGGPLRPPSCFLGFKALPKLRDQPSETTLTGRQYESRLRRQYERINPQPAWAKAAKDRLRETNDAEIDELLTSTSGLLASRSKKVSLPSGNLSIERLRDANQAAAASGSGEIKSLAFHPSAKVPVLCVGSADRRVRLFNVRSVPCPFSGSSHSSRSTDTLRPFYKHYTYRPSLFPSPPVKFHPSGTSLLLTGSRPFYFVYDLQRGEMQHKAGRGLWGSYDSTTSVTASHRKRGRGRGATKEGGGAEGMEITAFNPNGNVHLLDWKSGAGQVVGDALWWTGAGADGGELAALTNDSEVFLWDVGERRCVRRWKDEGGLEGAARAMTGSSKGWLAVGESTSFAAQPKPAKTLGHLTTAISTLRFNHDAQVMAVASREKKDALRLIHLPSLTAFSNWPTSSTPLGHVSAVDFSAQSEYVAVGNTRGKVLLYHLIDYGAARVFM
ncbi:WD40 repeat-like protein [Mycena filopes]|nr:WD40 repeat-like protein [Mycena filopes]